MNFNVSENLLDKKSINDNYLKFLKMIKQYLTSTQLIIYDSYMFLFCNKKLDRISKNFIGNYLKNTETIDLFPAFYSWFYSQTNILLPKEVFANDYQIYLTTIYFHYYKLNKHYLTELLSESIMINLFNEFSKLSEETVLSEHFVQIYVDSLLKFSQTKNNNILYLQKLELISLYPDIISVGLYIASYCHKNAISIKKYSLNIANYKIDKSSPFIKLYTIISHAKIIINSHNKNKKIKQLIKNII